MDSADAVVFEDGKTINAFAKWNTAVPNKNKLIWQPAYAGIAQSGELGFTTGPWEFKHKLEESPMASGSFSTIWHLNESGQWKFLVDIGTDGGIQSYPGDSVKKWVGTNIYDMDNRDALTIDRIFIQQYEALKNEAFKTVVTENTWFNLPGQKPVKGVQNILSSLQQIPTSLDFNPVGGGVSSSSDLAYVYGTVRHGATMANYLRVWQKEGSKYTMLLQVLQY